jgi:hypothetical protein
MCRVTFSVVAFLLVACGDKTPAADSGDTAPSTPATPTAPASPAEPQTQPETKPETKPDPASPEEPDGEKVNAVNQLRVSYAAEGGERQLVALLQFDKRHKANPVGVGADAPAYEAFTKLWAEVSATPELTWKHHDERGLTGTDHKPGDFNYIFAVEQAITGTPGFSVDMGTGVALKAERGGMTVGIVNVRDNAHGEVHVLVPGPDAEKLVEAWKQLQTKEKLGLDSHTNTKEGREYGTRLVPKGDPEYPWAVWSSLESGHGFLMDAL